MSYKIMFWVIVPCLLLSVLAVGNSVGDKSDIVSEVTASSIPDQIVKEANQILDLMNVKGISPTEAYVIVLRMGDVRGVEKFDSEGKLILPDEFPEKVGQSQGSDDWEIIGFVKYPYLPSLMKDRWRITANFQKTEGTMTTSNSIRWTNRQTTDRWVVEGFENYLTRKIDGQANKEN